MKTLPFSSVKIDENFVCKRTSDEYHFPLAERSPQQPCAAVPCAFYAPALLRRPFRQASRLRCFLGFSLPSDTVQKSLRVSTVTFSKPLMEKVSSHHRILSIGSLVSSGSSFQNARFRLKNTDSVSPQATGPRLCRTWGGVASSS